MICIMIAVRVPYSWIDEAAVMEYHDRKGCDPAQAIEAVGAGALRRDDGVYWSRRCGFRRRREHTGDSEKSGAMNEGDGLLT